MPLSKNTQQKTDLFRAKQQIITFAALLKYNNSQIESIQTLLSGTKNINEMIKNTQKSLNLMINNGFRAIFNLFNQPTPDHKLKLQPPKELRTFTQRF